MFSFVETTLNDKSIEGKRLVSIRGYLYRNNQKILTHHNLSNVKNPTHAIGMLKLGRVDAISDYYLDLRLNLPAEEMAALNYNPENPITSVKD